MRVYRPKRSLVRQRQSARNLLLIRDLRAERARLIDEVRELTAAVKLYQELLRRTENAPFVMGLRADALVS
jgi:hypothetical protein